jgi:branched-chain amino acid transport system permease protein
MTEFLQQLLNGLSLGAIYALIALGYTMVYGVLRFINFAHSDVFMVGAFIGYYMGRHVPTHGLGRPRRARGGHGRLRRPRHDDRAPRLPAAARAGHAQRPHHRHRRLAAARILRPGLLRRRAAAFPRCFPAPTSPVGGLVISSNQLIVIVVRCC